MSEPVWIHSEWCADCSTLFSSFRRKHHCRKCGNSVCHSCSSEKSTIPLYNIFSPVRVCKFCFITLKNASENANAQPELVTGIYSLYTL